MSHLELRIETPEQLAQRAPQEMHEGRDDPAEEMRATGTNGAPVAAPRRAAASMRALSADTVIDPLNPATWGKVGRNSPCPCGSGKKYKSCHGRL
jgi:preprotein translocase subunit SecA